MMSTRIPSVIDTYFQHKLLTKVVGQPTYESLQNLSTEIKANASSVPSTIGGGLYGHLGLILSDLRYATLADTVPWVTPTNPAPFMPPAGATGPQIEAAKDVWRELKLAFEICQATEKALIAQIVDSIEPIYLRALLNRTTGQYSNSIRAVLTHLFATHGKITPQQIKTKEMAVYNTHYSILLPVDTVFNSIDDLADLAGHANSPFSHQQMIDLAYVILAKEPILQQDLRLWNRRPIADRTWPNMLTHFREAQLDLSSLPIAGDIFHQQPPHHANSAITIADLVAQRLLDAMPPSDEIPIATAPTEVANAAVLQREASLAAREAALMSQMQEMMANIRSGSTNTNNNRNNRNNRSNRNTNDRTNNRNNDRNNNGGRGRPPAPRIYCWSHGACAHGSAQCNTQLPGHQTTATFANMQGGSTNNCFWLPA
jgi:hypothetical protein